MRPTRSFFSRVELIRPEPDYTMPE
jgi:hypothetical protein